MAEVKASFDLTTLDGKMKALNAQNGSGVSLKEFDDGEIIECTGIMQYEDTIDTYQEGQTGLITVLFGHNGESFASVSESVAKAGSSIIDFVKSENLDTFKVKIVKAKSKKDQVYLNLQLVL